MADMTLHALEPGDAGWLVMQHGLLYARDEGFDATFEALVAQVIAGFIRDHDPHRERAFIARRGGQRLGSIFCTREEHLTAQLRLFLLVPQARGQGLGRRMLAERMAFARDSGYRRMVLSTHRSHAAACALYQRTGWRCTATRPVVSFGVALEEMRWEVDL